MHNYFEKSRFDQGALPSGLRRTQDTNTVMKYPEPPESVFIFLSLKLELMDSGRLSTSESQQILSLYFKKKKIFRKSSYKIVSRFFRLRHSVLSVLSLDRIMKTRSVNLLVMVLSFKG